MSNYEGPGLPVAPKPGMRALLASLSQEEVAALHSHLLGDTGAAWVAKTLTKHGHPIGKTAVLEYRKSVRSV